MTPWILATATPEPFGFRCMRCGAARVLVRGYVTMEAYLAIGQAFARRHAHCTTQPFHGGTLVSCADDIALRLPGVDVDV